LATSPQVSVDLDGKAYRKKKHRFDGKQKHVKTVVDPYPSEKMSSSVGMIFHSQLNGHSTKSRSKPPIRWFPVKIFPQTNNPMAVTDTNI